MVSDACRCDVRDRAGRVVAEAALLDERLCRPYTFRFLGPGSLLGREQRELCLCHEDVAVNAETSCCREMVALVSKCRLNWRRATGVDSSAGAADL